ncbi:MAG: prepilin-type N-terminal cleavage/methylation domain-containing protein [Myxococcota bacterium]
MCLAPRAQTGFTLIEVLVTIMVVMLALTGLLAMQIGTTKANVDIMNYARAMAYAEELLEETRQAEWRAPCNAGCAGVGCNGSDATRTTTAVLNGPACVQPTLVPTVRAGCPPVGATICCDQLYAMCSDKTICEDPLQPIATRDLAASNCYDVPGINDPTPNTVANQALDRPPYNPTNIRFFRWVEMTDIDLSGAATLRSVRAMVRWKDAISERRGRDHAITVETIRRRQ